jgi:hypothetical protein
LPEENYENHKNCSKGIRYSGRYLIPGVVPIEPTGLIRKMFADGFQRGELVIREFSDIESSSFQQTSNFILNLTLFTFP